MLPFGPGVDESTEVKFRFTRLAITPQRSPMPESQAPKSQQHRILA